MEVRSNKHVFGFPLLIAIATLFVLTIQGSGFYAAGETTSNTDPDSYKFTTLAGDELKNNPMALKILKNIEISKQRIAAMVQKQQEIDEHKKFIDEQRRIADENLQRDLARMNRDYDDYAPRASFSRFLNNAVNATYHDLFWDEFNYHDQKVKLGREAMYKILQNGGSYQEARQVYFSIVAMSRTELIELNKKLNIQYGFADEETQATFDEYGKLPRYDD